MKLLIALAVLLSTAVFGQQGREDSANARGQGGKAAQRDQPEFEVLPKKGFSKSDCKGFFVHEELPYTVDIESFKATRTTINGPQDIVMQLRYKGSISHGKVKKLFTTEQAPTMHRAQSNTYGTHGQFYKTSLRNPFNFLKKYPDEELADVISKISVVAKKEVTSFDRGGSFNYETKRVKMQPIFMCITFDLTKTVKRKSSSTSKSHAFFLAPHVETLRKSLAPPPPKTPTEEI